MLTEKIRETMCATHEITSPPEEEEFRFPRTTPFGTYITSTSTVDTGSNALIIGKCKVQVPV